VAENALPTAQADGGFAVTPGTTRYEVALAAARLFRRQGYGVVTMRDIAAEVGLSKAGLYHHCPSKEGILADIILLARKLLLDQLEAARQTEGSALDRLSAFILTRVELVSEYNDVFAVGWREQPWPEEVVGIAESGAAQYRQGARELIEAARDAGQIRPDVDPHMFMLAIDGMTSWPGFWYREGGAHTPQEIGAQFLEFLLGSMRVSP
jgi:TetR/AcrR family transcriptional regulator, cholesterol catabolism regulator